MQNRKGGFGRLSHYGKSPPTVARPVIGGLIPISIHPQTRTKDPQFPIRKGGIIRSFLLPAPAHGRQLQRMYRHNHFTSQRFLFAPPLCSSQFTKAVFITNRERSGVNLLALMSGGCKVLPGAFISTLCEVPRAGPAEPVPRSAPSSRPGEKIILSRQVRSGVKITKNAKQARGKGAAGESSAC